MLNKSRFKNTEAEVNKAYKLHTVDGLTYEQIGERIGKSRSAVSSMIRRYKKEQADQAIDKMEAALEFIKVNAIRHPKKCEQRATEALAAYALKKK